MKYLYIDIIFFIHPLLHKPDWNDFLQGHGSLLEFWQI